VAVKPADIDTADKTTAKACDVTVTIKWRPLKATSTDPDNTYTAVSRIVWGKKAS
jgi:hypothetical protein